MTREPDSFTAYYQDRDDPSKVVSHNHNCHELILIESGVCDFTIEGRRYAASRGSLVIVGYLERHLIRVRETPYRRHVLLIPNRFCMDELRMPQLASLFLYRPVTFSHQLALEEGLFASVRQSFAEIEEECEGQRPLKGRRVALLLELMLIDLYRAHRSCFAWENSADMALVFSLQRYITERFREKLTLGSAAERFGASKYHISRSFSAVTGYRFSDYITVCRLNEAKRLLLSTDLPISQVAEASGYGDVNHFIRTFRQREGVPPYRYRKGAREEGGGA